MAAPLTEAQKKRLAAKRVIKGNDAITCCELAQQRMRGRIQSVITGLLEAISRPLERGAALALVVSPALDYRIITISETAAAGPAIPGLVVLIGGQLLIDIATATATYETIAVISTAIGLTFRDASSCSDCVLDRVLSQAAPRRREKAKILRRV